jgi:hypothetical protein
MIPSQCLYALILAMAKTSLLSLYMRIFGLQRWVRIHIWILTGIIWAWAASTILEAFLICSPFAYNWDTSIPGGVCGNRNVSFVSAGAGTIITDILVLVVPLPNIWGLRMPMAKKIALMFIFGLGVLCVQYIPHINSMTSTRRLILLYSVAALSIIRMISLGQINFQDITYSLIKPLLWSMVEVQLAIVVMNLPLLPPMMARILPFIRLGASKNTGDSSSGHVLTNITGSKRFKRLGDEYVNDGYILRKTEITVARGAEPLTLSEISLCATEEA